MTVTSTLTISASCAGNNIKPLTLDTGANVTINSGVTVSNDAPSNRNGDPVSVLLSSTSAALTNNGTISTGQQFGVTVNGILTSLVNTGTISSGVRRGIVLNGGTIGTLTNTGSVVGPFAGITNSAGTLQTFNNLQGAGNANGAVTYTGALPTNYNIIINSGTVYGKMTGTGVTGAMTFGIYGTSSVSIRTYTGVLSGFTAGNLTGATSGSFGGLNWVLSLASGSTTLWDLIFSSASTNMGAGNTYTLADVGVSANPVFDGGTLTLPAGTNSSQTFTLNSAGGTITSPTGSSALLSGVISGTGGLTVNGTGILALTGNNNYSGGTTVSSGTLTVGGSSPLGTGPIFVAAAGTLMGTGTLRGPLTVAGTLKPGNSPGFLAVNATVTMNSGSTYQQDIAGKVQASATSPVGATGYYSFLNITGGQFVIQPSATLTPRLSGLFTPGEPGFGSTPYVPVLGDRFRLVTADGGISGRFSTLTQPAGLSAGTQLVQFYNVAGSKSLDLAVIPTSYTTTLSAQTGNTGSVAGALDTIVQANQAGLASSAQDQLLYAASGQTASSLPAFTRALAGEVYGASLAAVSQAMLRTQQAVLSHLDGADFSPPSSMGTSPMRASSADSVMLASTRALDSGISFDRPAENSSSFALTQGPAWGEVAYQRGRRSGNRGASGFTTDLYQLVLGADVYAGTNGQAGVGLALSNTDVNAEQGKATVQQGSAFLYAKLPLGTWVMDTTASFGLHSANHARTDPTGYTTGLGAKTHGRSTLLSAGLSHPFDLQETRVTPYARVIWQQLHQSSADEGASAAALTVNSFNNKGVRTLIGLSVSPKNTNPLRGMRETDTYRFHVAVGADTSKLANPSLNASLAGVPILISTPRAGAGFVQAGFYGTTRLGTRATGYLGVSGEARKKSVQGSVNAGVRLQF